MDSSYEKLSSELESPDQPFLADNGHETPAKNGFLLWIKKRWLSLLLVTMLVYTAVMVTAKNVHDGPQLANPYCKYFLTVRSVR